MPLSANKNVWVSLFIIFALLSGVFLTLFYFRDLFIVIIVGLCLIAVLDRAIRLFNGVTRPLTPRIRKTAACFVWLVFFGVLVMIVMYAVDHVAYLLMNLAYFEQLIQDGTRELELLISDLIGHDEVSDVIGGLVSRISESIFSSIGSLLSSAAYFALCAILLYPFMFYVSFRDMHRIRRRMTAAFPAEFRDGFDQAVSSILFNINNYFNAKIIESLAIAAVACTGFYLIGIEKWLLLGCLLGLLNNIPYIGPWIGSVPPLIIALTISIKAAFLVAVVCVIAQIVDNAYLIPVVISKKVSVNSLLTVFLIMSFAQAFGALGMILALPIYIVYRIVLTESYRQLIRIFPSDTTGTPEEENFDPLAYLAACRKKKKKTDAASD